MYREFPFIPKWVNIIMLFFPLTSFLLLPAIQGTTISTVMAGMLFGLVFLLPVGEIKLSILKETVAFFAVVLFLSFGSQMMNLIWGLKLSGDLELINRANYLNSFYRLSHITQTLYLTAGFIIYLLVKYFADERIIDYIYWGLRLICFYGLYEFIYYFLTGQNGDFVTNRTFGKNDKVASIFQTINLGGLNLMRLKGYTGEPSMFTFTVMPFWILAVSMKRRFDSALLLTCLMLTFSTTSYMCICGFLAFWYGYKRQYKLVISGIIVLLIAIATLQFEPFSGLFTSIYDTVFADKLSGEGVSAQSRGGNFQAHMTFWSNLAIPHQLFGIGFGYIRSTDFFSTLFLNTGLLGFIVFTAFVFKNVKLNVLPQDVNMGYKGGLVALYIIMMATVPEFAYPCLWIYLALGYILQRKSQEIVVTTASSNYQVNTYEHEPPASVTMG